jgi:ribosomal protein S12 methylthiotransferase accessory factor YcaO
MRGMNRARTPLPKADRKKDASPRHLGLQDFHPYGPEYEAYLENSTELPTRICRDEISGRLFEIPQLLTDPPAPFERNPGLPVLSESGNGVRPTRESAILQGALDLLKRHDFFPAFLNESPGTRIDPIEVISEESLELLKERELSTWVIQYSPESDIPLLHIFLHSPRNQTLARGSGAGLTLRSAAESALEEALQMLEAHSVAESLGRGKRPDYDSWATSVVIHRVIRTLERHPRGYPKGPAYTEEKELLQAVMRTLKAMGFPLLVIEPRCHAKGLCSARVLIPGLTTSPHGSLSRGGEALLGAAFRWPVPV